MIDDAAPTGRRMRARRAALLAATLAAVVITSALTPVDVRAADGWTSTRTETYVHGDVGPMLGMLSTGGCGFGTVCLGDTVGDTFTVVVIDDSGRRVGGVVQVRSRGGWTVLSQPFCGSSGPLRAVHGTLTVHLDAPGDVSGAHWFGGPGCREINPLGGPAGATTQGVTSGRVRVTFTAHG